MSEPAQVLDAQLSGQTEYGPVGLLVLQGTPLCNLACSYCYLSAAVRSTKAQMSIDTVEATIARLLEDGLLGDHMSVTWHAGEPLVLDAAFYDERMSRFQRVAEAGTQVQHSLQTNGTLITDLHCELFRKFDVEVGLSVDGPAFVHDRQRPGKGGQETHARVMQGVERLSAHDVSFQVICVLTDFSMRYPDNLYDYFRDLGCTGVAFNLEELEGANKRSSLTTANGIALFEPFLERFWERLRADGFPFVVREFSETQRRILAPRRWRNAQTDPLLNVNVAWNGEWSTFCPELLDEERGGVGAYRFGNVHTCGFRAATLSARFGAIRQEILSGVDACRATCSYFGVCYGGNPANKLAENGTMDSTETLNCRIRIKFLFDFMLKKLEQKSL